MSVPDARTPSTLLPSRTSLVNPHQTSHVSNTVGGSKMKPKKKKASKAHVPRLERLMHRLKKDVRELHEMQPKFSTWIREGHMVKPLQNSGNQSQYDRDEAKWIDQVKDLYTLFQKIEGNVEGMMKAINAAEKWAAENKKAKESSTDREEGHKSDKAAKTAKAEADLMRAVAPGRF